MADKIHDEQLSAKLDAFLNAGCDFARACFQTWLARRAGDQAGAVEVERESAPTQGEKLLTLDELSTRLGRNKRTIQEWVSDYGLPELRAHPAADPLFDWREVLQWMKRHRKNLHTEKAGNVKLVPQAPIGTRSQATLRRS